MSNWIEVCAFADLETRNMKKVSVGESDILIVKTDEGVYAVSDTCSHAEVSLSEGSLMDCKIECWAHGAVFDVRDGSVLTPPASDPIRTYETQVQGDGENAVILIKVGE
jgi:3-phenylpropionate/trans-cinnamate dioxygenase ferredoxin subunit